MGEEIERKFLVPAVPDGLAAGEPVRQGYLAVDGPVEVRLRRTAAGDRVTIKAGVGLARTEVELVVRARDADALWPHTAGRQIEKVRHRVPVADGWTAEVDVYGGDLAGLCVAEVEFPTLADADGFRAPGWFGEEVTGRPGWSNAALARHGRPPDG